MSDLKKVREWLLTYPKPDPLLDLQVDYYAAQPENGSIAPSGLVEISRAEDILGNITVRNQYNFALHFMLLKPVDGDAIATSNAEWLMDLQRWVQEQSIQKKAPTFGDVPQTETIKAQNGELTWADEDGTGIYTVLLSIDFTKKYEVN